MSGPSIEDYEGLVRTLSEQSDRYRDALASMDTLYLNADEPEACPVHRVQMYGAITIPRVHHCAWVEAVQAVKELDT